MIQATRFSEEPFFKILARKNSNLVYIDGFAGRGTYDLPDGDVAPGSPLRALHVIAASPDSAKRVSTIFVEKDRELYEQLREAVDRFCDASDGIRKPQVLQGKFDATLDHLLEEIRGKDRSLAPAFLFVDPCGVDGVAFESIRNFLQEKSSEVFIFFNIEGARRIFGLEAASESPTLRTLLGTQERVSEVLDVLRGTGSPAMREAVIINFYKSLILNETSAKYVSLFRVEAENRRTVSHYLIHATSHSLGFKIMKDVMYSIASGEQDGAVVGLRQASANDGLTLFNERRSRLDEFVREHLASGPQRVSYITDEQAQRAEVQFAPKELKAALIRLEAAGVVRVTAKDGSDKTEGANSRRRNKGETTLGEDYFVRLVVA